METILNSIPEDWWAWLDARREGLWLIWHRGTTPLEDTLGRWLVERGFIQEEDQILAINLALFFLLLMMVLLIWNRLARGRRTAAMSSLAEATRSPRLNGYLAIFVLLAIFGGWSFLAPLAGASIAPGVVSPDGSRKSVEHLEGGIVKTIHVAEGDQVVAGAVLFTMDDIQATARYSELRQRYLFLRAAEARLFAERDSAAQITFPAELAEAQKAETLRIMNSQNALFESRSGTLQGREDILQRRILQLWEQNLGLLGVIENKEEQITFISEEIEAVEGLFRQGLEKYPRLLALKRGQAEIRAEIAASRARIAENREKIGETEIQLLTLSEQALERANSELTEVQRQLAEIATQLPSRQNVLDRTVVRAPIEGTVLNLTVTTETEVIHPGETLLEIVPEDGALVIDAKISPTDIERVRSGMEARVILTAYRQRGLPLIHGVLRSVSADRLEEDRTGEPFYLAKVEVNAEDLAALEDVTLKPGMPAEIMILDGEQSLLQYLLDPLMSSFDHSFREG